jgi:predicted patatin/cPLA2 family phospholipase
MKLVLEGGGVRAAYSAGLIHALVEADVAISATVGSSSGSINAAFAATRQTATLCTLWSEFVPSSRFISWRRQFTPWGKPGLDIDEMLDNVIAKDHLLDEALATAGPTHFYVTATDVDAQRCVVKRPPRASLYQWLRASLALPVGYNRIVEVEGRRFVDGGVTCPVAFDVPLDQEYPGPTVVVLTRKMETAKPAPRAWERLAVRTIVPKGASELSLVQHELHNAVMQRLKSAVERGEVILVDPPSDMPLSRLTRDPATVRRGVEIGKRVGAALAKRLPKR